MHVTTNPPPRIAPAPVAKAPIATQASPPRLHLGYLDGLRALAALYVLLGHAVLTIWPQPAGFHGLILLLAGPLRYGHYAVGLFIVLSGFCLMLPVVNNNGILKGGVLLFVKRRARRILPPYYCALALSLFLIWLLIGHKTTTFWNMSLPATPASVLSCLLLMQDIYYHSKINYSFWSIAVEWQIYFLFPLLVLASVRFGSVRTTLLAFAASCTYFFVFRHSLFLGTTPQFLTLFSLGMLAATMAYSPAVSWKKLREGAYWGWVSGLASVVVLLLSFVWRKHTTKLEDFAVDMLVGIAASALLVVASGSRGHQLRRILGCRPLAFVGAFAYSIYLIHAPLLQVVWQYALAPLHRSPLVTFLLLATVGAVLIVGVSYLFFLACERPFLNTHKRKAPAHLGRDAALSPTQ